MNVATLQVRDTIPTSGRVLSMQPADQENSMVVT